MAEQWFGVADAAPVVGMSERTIRRRIVADTLPWPWRETKEGWQVLIDPEQVETADPVRARLAREREEMKRERDVAAETALRLSRVLDRMTDKG